MRDLRCWALPAVLVACLVSTSAQGSDLRVVSSFVAAGTVVPAECSAEAAIVARVLSMGVEPRDWHWVVVCDEAAWRRFLSLSGRPGEDAILASTDVAGRTTYFRGDKLLHPLGFCADPREVIGHELAHIRLQGGDEWSAERLNRSQRKAWEDR